MLTAVSKFGRKRGWLIRLFLVFRLILSVLELNPRLTISTDKCNTNGLFPTHRTIAGWATTCRKDYPHPQSELVSTNSCWKEDMLGLMKWETSLPIPDSGIET